MMAIQVWDTHAGRAVASMRVDQVLVAAAWMPEFNRLAVVGRHDVCLFGLR